MMKLKNSFKPLALSTTLLLAAVVGGCGGSSNHGGGGGRAGPSPAPIGSTCSGTDCVDLGKAAHYVILAEAGITYTPTATVTSTPKITGNIGISPAEASVISGFALDLPAGGAYSTSTLLAGAVYAPAPSNLTTAVGAKLAAYSAASAMATAGGGLPAGGPNECPGAGALGGLTLTPGVYTCAVAVSIGTGTTVTLYESI